jgi:hypothetical protein
MDQAQTHQRRRRGQLPLLVVIGLFAYAVVQNYLHNGVVAVHPPPPGYTYRVPRGHYTELLWPDLRRTKWDGKTRPTALPSVSAQDGKLVRVKGFLLPLHEANASSEFFIGFKPAGCPFCNPQGPAELALVQVKGGKKLSVTDLPICAYGTLHMATGAPTDSALYTVKDAVLVVSH